MTPMCYQRPMTGGQWRLVKESSPMALRVFGRRISRAQWIHHCVGGHAGLEVV